MSLDAADHKRVLFLGETIEDVYHYGKLQGRPLKEAIICVEYQHTEAFQGGVVAAARHAETFCQAVDVVSTLRIRKDRFVEESHNRKLFEVYTDSVALAAPVLPAFGDYDAVVVTDYGHGMFNDALIEKLCADSRFLAVNVQTNSGNYGFNLATKWPRADYLCMDEIEARLATRNREGAIEGSVEELSGISPRVAVTLGRHGAVGIDEHGVVRCGAFSGRVTDTMGAGDAFFAITAVLAEETPMADLLRIGNAAGKLKALYIGHRQHVTKSSIKDYLDAHPK